MIFSHPFVIIQVKTSPICPHTYINMYTYRYDYVLVTCFIAVEKISDKSKLSKEQFEGIVQHGKKFLIPGG